MLHILDDFFFIGPRDALDCGNELTHVLYFCKQIEVQIKMSKNQPSSTKIFVYGIEIDSEIMQARLTFDKVEKPRLALEKMVHRGSTTLKDPQSLIGLLHFS